MSILNKFTVPLGSDGNSAANQGLLMPKLAYRFRLSFENFGVSTPTTELTKQVLSAGRPNVDFESVEQWVYNSRIVMQGRPKWGTLSIKLRDDVTGGVSKLVGEQMQKQFDFYEQSSAASGIDYKFTTRIEILDGGNGTSTPQILETWELYGCFLSDVNYGDANYGQNEAMTITMAIRMDNALQTTGGGVGTSVPRGTGTVITG